MEVAKYIGLFLLKNNSCYIHGLGNIELRRKPATYDGRNLLSAIYDIVVVPANTVDDALSNFIATNEQISISKASNALKEFTEAAKVDLAEGREVAIPSLGSFAQVNEKLHFVTTSLLQHQYAGIPAEKTAAKRTDEKRPIPQAAYQHTQAATQDYTFTPPVQHESLSYPQQEEEEEKKRGIVWWRLILFILILAALIGGIGFAVRNMLRTGGNASVDSSLIQKQIVPVDTLINNAAPLAIDTLPLIDTENTMALPGETATTNANTGNSTIAPANSNTTQPAATVTPTVQKPVVTPPVQQPITTPAQKTVTATPKTEAGKEMFKVLLNTYDDRAVAEKRLKQLKAAGNNVELYAEDTATFDIVISVPTTKARRQRVLDSLKNKFNPLGVEAW
jgi:nucleoid DNA-binding protein/Flp pilus assembly protein TadG